MNKKRLDTLRRLFRAGPLNPADTAELVTLAERYDPRLAAAVKEELGRRTDI